MVDYIDDFQAFLIDVKNASKSTIESYMRDIGKFISYCNQNHISSLSSVNEGVINKYEEYLNFIGQSEASVSRALASLRCYFGYLISKNIVTENPMANLKKRHCVRKLPEVLTNKEVITLLNQPSGSDCKSFRDKAMLELLYATGIKVSELIELKLSDINLQIGILHMHSGNSERIIPIYPQAVKAIKTYIQNVRHIIVLSDEEDKLFTNMNGQKMTRQGFWKIVKQYAAAAKIKKDITPHTLRHSFAAHLLENGAELTDIQEMLGHADISSTQIYAQLMKSKYAQAYTKYHPLAR